MSTNMEDLRRDVRKNPADLEQEADRARDAVEDTLQELGQQLSPSELMHRVIDTVKRNGGDFGENLVSQVRSNPVPLLLTGVGIAWLMMASRGASGRHGSEPNRSAGGDFDQERADSAEEGSSGLRDRWSGSAAHDAMGATANAARSAASTIRGATDAASGAASRATSAARHSAEAMTQASRRGVQRVTEGYSYLTREQPLVLGALAIVAGAAIGALLPSTANEDEWLGDASDEAKARLKSEARSTADDLEAAAMTAASSVQDSMMSNAEDENGGEPSADKGEASDEYTTDAGNRT